MGCCTDGAPCTQASTSDCAGIGMLLGVHPLPAGAGRDPRPRGTAPAGAPAEAGTDPRGGTAAPPDAPIGTGAPAPRGGTAVPAGAAGAAAATGAGAGAGAAALPRFPELRAALARRPMTICSSATLRRSVSRPSAMPRIRRSRVVIHKQRASTATASTPRPTATRPNGEDRNSNTGAPFPRRRIVDDWDDKRPRPYCRYENRRFTCWDRPGITRDHPRSPRSPEIGLYSDT